MDTFTRSAAHYEGKRCGAKEVGQYFISTILFEFK